MWVDLKNQVNSLSSILSSIESAISREALHQRFTPEAANFLKCCLEHVIATTVSQSRPVDFNGLEKFNRVCIWDSSGWQLNERLKGLRGAGGSGSKAGCKLQYCYDLKSSSVIHCELTDGVTPDQRYGQEQLAAKVQAGDLFLFDLGYFALKTLAAVEERGAFFISRLDSHVAIFLNNQRLELTSWLKKHKSKDSIEISVLLGHQKIPCRLIARRLPEKERNERIRRLRKLAAKKGRVLSTQGHSLASWNLFVTNAPQEKLPANHLHHFYRLRWSVELIFKQFKSQLKIHTWNHRNIYRLKCEIFATLIIAALLSFSHNLLQTTLWNKSRKDKRQGECSFEKTVKFFANHSHILFQIASGTLIHPYTKISALLRKAALFCLKYYQPSRRSSLQYICELA